MTIAGQQDKDLFTETMDAFQIMSIPEEETIGIILFFYPQIFTIITKLFHIIQLRQNICETSRSLIGLFSSVFSLRFVEGGVSRAAAGKHGFQEGA